MDDLTNFLKDGSGGPADLDWLDVDESDYRTLDTLPRQNLDVVPDLKALWRHQDEPAARFVPNTGAPKTMGDLSQFHGKLASDVTRTARLAIMQSADPMWVKNALNSRYDLTTLRACRTALAGVLAERGLLGPYYIDASDFPTCASGSKKASEFVRRFAPTARFLKAKDACKDCVHRKGTVAGDHCSVFHKQIVMEVPYTEELADAVEKSQGKKTAAGPAQERIRGAFLATASQGGQGFSGRQQTAPKPAQGNAEQGLVALSNLTKKRDEAAAQKLAAQKAQPVIATLRREMLKGRNREELIQALKLAFDPRDLAATRAYWEPLFKEAGLYGVIYTTQDSFADCREGADFLSKHASKTRAVVAGSKCQSCIFSKIGRCLMYGKRLVGQAEAVINPETVAAVLDEHKLAGKLPYGAERMDWGKTARDQLRNLHQAATGPKPAAAMGVRSNIEQAFYGSGNVRDASANELVKRDIVKVARQFLNEGLYGQDLLTLLRGRFLDNDIKAAAEMLKPVLAEQGLQGIKYVDPTAYDDYGKGCKTAAAKHRSRKAVRYAKVAEGCASCVHQTRPGFCSVLDKQLVIEPPYVDKAREQAAVLASGRATEVSYESLMNNGLSMMQEYELQHQAGTIELSPEPTPTEATIEFGVQDIKL